MLGRTIYLSLLLEVIKSSNESLDNSIDDIYDLEIDYLEINSILEKDRLEDQDLVEKVIDFIKNEKEIIEKEKNIIINIEDWEFQVDLKEIKGVEDLTEEERCKLLEKSEITLSINSEKKGSKVIDEKIKEFILERKSMFYKN